MLSKLLLILWALAAQTKRPHFTQHGFFTHPSLFPLQSNAQSVGRILALVDLNSDTFTDILTLSSDGRHIQGWLFDSETFRYKAGGGFSLDFGSLQVFGSANNDKLELGADERILSATTADLDHDGRTDLVLLLSSSRLVYVRNSGWEWQAKNSFLVSASSAVGSEPLLVDFYARRHLQLLIPTTSKDTLVLEVMQFDVQSFSFSTIETLSLSSLHPDCTQFPAGHSSGVVDLDGDCRPDLFLHCSNADNTEHFYSVHSWNGTGYNLASSERKGKFKTRPGPITFGDLDGDSTLDVVYPTCSSPTSCELKIVYNRQIPFCTSSGDGNGAGCRTLADLCKQDPSYLLDVENPSTIALGRLIQQSVSADYKSLSSTATSDKDLKRVVLADVNLDGYVDIILHVSYADGGMGLVILSSPYACSQSSTGYDDKKQVYCDGTRAWTVLKTGTASLMKQRGVKDVTVMDLDEKGFVDIVGVSSDTTTNMFAYLNNLYNDAFFLKLLVTSPTCWKYCRPSQLLLDKWNGTDTTKPLGTSFPGAVMKFTLLNMHGQKRLVTATQTTQGSRPDLPYAMVGLGRTNNYIEEVVVGVQGDGAMRTGLIPNSWLMIYPPTTEQTYLGTDGTEPFVSPRAGQEQWIFELYINPGQYLKWVCGTLIVLAVVLGFIVAGLKWREVREDDEERKRGLHVLNFDAL